MGHNHNEKVVAGLINANDLARIREAVCIQTDKIYDSCRDKDCIEDARVIFRNPEAVQGIIDNAINVKVRRAEVIDVYADVESVPFKRGFYTVDIKFFIRVTLDFFVQKCKGGVRIITIHGLVVFDKKVILFGSEGNVKIFRANFTDRGIDEQVHSRLEESNLPAAKVEVAEPITLSAKIVDLCDCHSDCCCESIPRGIEDVLGAEEDLGNLEELMLDSRGPDRRVVEVSLGLFSIVKLTRFVQLLIPAFDFCVPNSKKHA